MADLKQKNNGTRVLVLAAVVLGFFTLASLTGIGLFYEANKDRVIKVSNFSVLKEKLEKDANNEALKSEIREADRIDRAKYFGMLELIEKGKYPLTGFFILFVILLKVYFSLNPSLPEKQKTGETKPGKFRYRAVISLSGIFLVLCAGMLISAFFDASSYFLSIKPKPAAKADEWGGDEPAAPYSVKPAQSSAEWPGLRGPDGSAIAGPGKYPVNFNYKTGENILWKTELSVNGYSSPVVCGNRIYLAGESEGSLKLMCFDAVTGKSVFTAAAVPKAKKNEQIPSEKDGGSGMAAATPACDGKNIYMISPTADAFCFDLSGRQLWAVDLGTPESVYGLASSPLLLGDKVILQLDKLKDGALLAALDKKDGKIAWKVKRKVQASWSTPGIAGLNGKKGIITFADPDAIAYSADGAELWKASVISGEISSSPVSFGGITYAASATSLFALDASGKQLWEAEKDTNINSPVTDGKKIILAQAGSIACYTPHGKLFFKQEVKGEFWASPVLAGDICYAPGLEGAWHIFKFADKYEPLAEFETGERTAATPAFVNGKIFIRTEKNLYCAGIK